MFCFRCQQYMFTLHVVYIILLLCVSNLRRVFSKRSFWWHSAYFHSALYPSFHRKNLHWVFHKLLLNNFPYSAFRKIALPCADFSICHVVYTSVYCRSTFCVCLQCCQIWRPVTALFFYPLMPQTGFQYLLNLYFLYSYSTRLETGTLLCFAFSAS